MSGRPRHLVLKFVLWGVLTIIVFSLFYWLFGLAMPDVAFEFAFGITLIIVGGLLFGVYVARVTSKTLENHQNIILVTLVVLALFGFVSIGFIVNRMIGQTDFFHFSLAVLLFFLESAFAGAFVVVVKNRIARAETSMANSKSELQLLQSQLSPHFLFNTLNNLYGISMSQPEKVPDLLLRLSSLLRYSVYDTKELFVPVNEEWEYLKNYIHFERMRLGDRLDLNLRTVEIENSSYRIAPMLLIVFVENAFKHSKNSRDEKIFVEIGLTVKENKIVFFVKNSRSEFTRKSVSIEKHSGFGLESVKKRLELLYENTHELTIEESEGEYTVNLMLQNK